MITNAVTLEQGVTVTQLKGQIYLVAADGSRKLLAEGDVLPKGAVIMSPDGASFMGGGQSFNVQPASEQSEPTEEGDAPQLAQNGAAGTPDDINALQQAILGGADPTQAFEASAAGGAPAAGGGGIGGVAGASGNGGFVTIDRTGSATIAEATFDTTYNANGEPPLEAVGEDDPLFTSANLVLSADAQVNEGGFITFTATLDEPVFGSDLVIQLSNGVVITIPVGQSSGSVTVAAPADSPYVDPSTITVSITGTQGGGFNQIITGPSTTTQINDTVDTTTVTLDAPAQVNEGGQITYSASVNNAPQSDLVLTLSNGASITIKAGELSGSVTVDAPSDDVYKDGSSLTVSITGSSGGNYEQLDTSSKVTTEVADTVDTTTVTLSSATNGQTVTEGGSIVYTASVSNPVTGSPLTVTLSNGVVINIPVGSSSANSEPVPVRGDDIYQQGEESLSVTIDKTSGGNYENLVSSGTITNTVVDDNDTAFTLKLFAVDAQGNVVGSSTVSEEGETSAYYVVRAVDANGNVLETQPTGNVNVSFGNLGTTSSADYSASKTTVAVGEVFSAKAVNDALADNGEQFKVSLNGGSFSEAGKYEKVEYSDATVTTTITDETGNDPDVPGDNDTAFTLKLFAVDAQGNVVDSSTVSEEGETSAYYVVRAVDANGNVLATQPTGNVNVSFGNLGTTSSADYSASKTTVAVGEVFSAKAVNDALADNGEQFKVSLNGGSFSEAGKYEKVEYSDATVTTTITDETGNDPDVPGDNDTAFTLKLFAVDAQGNVVGSSTVSEEGETSAYYVVRAVDANGNVLATQPTGNVNVSFGNLGTTSSADYSASKTTVAVGEVFSAKAVNDALADNGEQFKVSLNGGSFSEAGKYEKVEYSDATVTTTITDETGNDPDVPGDNDTAFTLKLFAVDAQGNVVGSSTVSEEGETSAYYVVRAVDANGNVLATQPTGNVNVSFGNLGTTSSADYSASKTTVAVGEVFSAKAVNDALADNGEQFKVSLNGGSFSEAGKYEKVEYSDATVTTTILDNDSLVALQDVVEGTSNNVLNVADGVAFTGATALGGTVSLLNGKYVYQAPVRDHADSIADTDSFTYTKADGSTVTYNINILDTNPLAANDSGSFAVGLNVQTAGSTSLLANDMVVDSSVAKSATVHSVTGLNGTAVELGADGSVTVAGKYGDLTVSADGSYTYTSKLDTDVQAVEGGAAVKSAFAVYGFQNNSLPLNGTSLNLTGLTDSATALVDVRTSGNNSKPGIGVSQSGNGTNDIGSGESLVIGLKALSNFAQIGINELNSGQGSASWKAYDANGVLVGSGTLVSSSSNGSLQSFNISTSTPFQYLVLGYSGNQNGYVIDSIKYTPAIGAVTEEFTYTVKDNDGDVSNSAVLTLNGNVPTTVAPTMLMGVEDTDVPLTWASFGISDNASTVRISGNQDGTGTIRYLDVSTNLYKELGKNETKTFTKADIDSGKVKFDPEDNVSGADVYGNDKGVGNKGHDLTSIKFDVLKGNQVIASDKSVVVDLTPKADAPTLKVGTFSSLAAMDFENVGVGTGGWKDNINPNSINGAGAIGQWHANGSGLIEVGKESVYLGNKATSTTNQVMEIESSRNVSQLYTDIQCESGRFYQLNFDISARTTPQNIDISSCGLKVFLVQLDANGRQISESRIDLYDFAPKSVGWLKGVPVPLKVPETGTYRLVFESKDASGNGDSYGAVLDNVKFQAVDNKGYEDSFIKLGKIDAELVDKDGSERLSVEIEGLPVGAVLKDAANHIVIVKDDTHKVDVTGWSLSTLQLKVNDPGHYNLVVKATAKEVTSSGTVLDSAVSKVILPVEVLAANATPVITATSVAVSEEGLPGGLIDTTDFRGQDTNLDSTSDTSVSGKLTISDANGDIIQSVKLVAPTERITSGDTDIKWTVSADGMTLTGKVGNDGPTAVTVTIDKQGNYNVNLFKPLDHVNADNVEGRLAINVGVEASDGKVTGTGTLTIQVEDDKPVVTDGSAVLKMTAQPTNLMLVLDVSTSMGERPSGGNGLTRFEMAQQALIKLLDRYQELGDVRVQLVTFSDIASIKTATWVDAAIAKQVINGLDYEGNTNYDDALEKAKAAFTQTGAIAGAKNVAYFLSDGQPNKPSRDTGIDSDEQDDWESFLKINKITAYAVGMGSGATISALEPIAFNGADASKSVNAFVAKNESELASQLQETIAPSVIGNLLTVGSVSAGIGADGGRLSSVTVDKVLYSWGGGSATPSNLGSKASYNSTTHELTITTAAGGKLVIDLDDGSYRYQAASKAAMGYQETVGFSVVDRDGDSVNANVTFNIVPDGNAIKTGDQNDSVYLSSDRPSVAAHTAIEINGIHYSQPGTYQDGTVGVVIKKDSADTVYTYGGNDHVEGGRGNDVVYLGDSGSNLVDFSSAIDFVKADVATITLQPAIGVAREDGDLISAKASVAWGDVAQGAQGNDFLFGEDGVDLLFGGSGNDYLDGGKDRDFIRGGSGDDVILGGAGSDYLRGEEGADTFLWQQGDDALVQGSGNSNMLPTHPVDYITDFQVQHGDGWQLSSNKVNYFKDVDIARSDKLDLSDLLDHSGNKNESNLATLLSVFEKEGDVHLQVKTADGSKVRQEIVLLDSTFESITGDSDNHVYDSTGSTSEQVINYMLQNHLLDIDK